MRACRRSRKGVAVAARAARLAERTPRHMARCRAGRC